MGAEKRHVRIAGFWCFLRFRVGVAGNGDVAPPGWRGFREEVPGINPEKNANFGVILQCGIVSRWN
jgi:hypothetical protein